MKRSLMVGLAVLLLMIGAAWTARRSGVWMGRQPDGSFLVSSGQRVEAGSIAFTGRPIDLALHPTRGLFAVLNKGSVLLATTRGVVAGSEASLGASAGFRGLVWTPDGRRLLASTEPGHIQIFGLDGERLRARARISLNSADKPANPV